MEGQASAGLLELLLLQSGDVEQNPGPPRRNRGAAGAEPKRELSKEEKDVDLGSKVWDRVCAMIEILAQKIALSLLKVHVQQLIKYAMIN